MEKTFRTVISVICSKKIRRSMSVLFMCDLHSVEFGKDNRTLLRRIEELSPDLILCGGDMMIRRHPHTMKQAYAFMRRAAKKAPVYYAFGNHETVLSEKIPAFGQYMRHLEEAGVVFLRNQTMDVACRGNHLKISGLETDEIYYQKPFSPMLTGNDMKLYLGDADRSAFTVLLAHNPKYGDTYFRWGADLILSGHYHGGILRLGEHTGLTNPQFHPFPRYCCGTFRQGDSRMLVSAGLGEHTLPLRFHNPREMHLIRLLPSAEKGSSGPAEADGPGPKRSQ